jgi:hypothetical protein
MRIVRKKDRPVDVTGTLHCPKFLFDGTNIPNPDRIVRACSGQMSVVGISNAIYGRRMSHKSQLFGSGLHFP